MGYTKANGKWANTEDVNLFAAAARTATANGPTIEVGEKGTACLDLACSAASGTTPTLDVKIQTSKDGTTWRDVASFAQLVAAGSERKSFVGLDRFARGVATIGGTTPSFTFSVSGELK